MYGYRSFPQKSATSQKRTRLIQLAFLVLSLTILVLIWFYVNASAFRDAYNRNVYRAIAVEADSALSQHNNLSRTGGSNTESVLGKVRQHVNAARVLVEQYADLNGKVLIDLNLFNSLSNVIDQYEIKKQAGQAVIQYHADLTSMLESLSFLAHALS